MNHQSPQLAHQIKDACQRLGIGRSTLYKLIQSGEIRTIHVGRSALVPETELTAYVERKLAEVTEAK